MRLYVPRLPLAAPVFMVLAGVAVAAATDDRQAAELALSTLSAAPSTSALAERPIAMTRDALTRAEDARAANDPEHAARLEALAREWATTGTDLVRAAAVEEHANAAQRRAAELEGSARRARALLEQTVARRGRAEARLQVLEAPSASPVSSATPGGAP